MKKFPVFATSCGSAGIHRPVGRAREARSYALLRRGHMTVALSREMERGAREMWRAALDALATHKRRFHASASAFHLGRAGHHERMGSRHQGAPMKGTWRPTPAEAWAAARPVRAGEHAPRPDGLLRSRTWPRKDAGNVLEPPRLVLGQLSSSELQDAR